jgi:hypothetical protein
MSDLAIPESTLPPAPPEVIELIRTISEKMEAREASLPEDLRFRPQMEHVLHAGMYARTCRLAAGVAITSVLIKIPTMLIVHGGAHVFAGGRWYKIEGYQCMPAAALRMQVYVTFQPTEITMIFPSNAETVEQAEAEFTDAASALLSRRQDNGDIVIVTGVKACRG